MHDYAFAVFTVLFCIACACAGNICGGLFY